MTVNDSSLPYKYMPQEIKELSQDIKNIETILSNNTDPHVKQLSEELVPKLTTSKTYFEKKLANIPNQQFMDESDEEWVAANKPS